MQAQMNLRGAAASRAGLKPQLQRMQRTHLARQLHKMSATAGAPVTQEKAPFQLPVVFVSTEVRVHPRACRG